MQHRIPDSDEFFFFFQTRLNNCEVKKELVQLKNIQNTESVHSSAKAAKSSIVLV